MRRLNVLIADNGDVLGGHARSDAYELGRDEQRADQDQIRVTMLRPLSLRSLDVHGEWSRGSQLTRLAFTDAREQRGATKQQGVTKKALADVCVALRDGLPREPR